MTPAAGPTQAETADQRPKTPNPSAPAPSPLGERIHNWMMLPVGVSVAVAGVYAATQVLGAASGVPAPIIAGPAGLLMTMADLAAPFVLVSAFFYPERFVPRFLRPHRRDAPGPAPRDLIRRIAAAAVVVGIGAVLAHNPEVVASVLDAAVPFLRPVMTELGHAAAWVSAVAAEFAGFAIFTNPQLMTAAFSRHRRQQRAAARRAAERQKPAAPDEEVAGGLRSRIKRMLMRQVTAPAHLAGTFANHLGAPSRLLRRVLGVEKTVAADEPTVTPEERREQRMRTFMKVVTVVGVIAMVYVVNRVGGGLMVGPLQSVMPMVNGFTMLSAFMHPEAFNPWLRQHPDATSPHGPPSRLRDVMLSVAIASAVQLVANAVIKPNPGWLDNWSINAEFGGEPGATLVPLAAGFLRTLIADALPLVGLTAYVRAPQIVDALRRGAAFLAQLTDPADSHQRPPARTLTPGTGASRTPTNAKIALTHHNAQVRPSPLATDVETPHPSSLRRGKAAPPVPLVETAAPPGRESVSGSPRQTGLHTASEPTGRAHVGDGRQAPRRPGHHL